jgi:prephenate dehydrogenase
VPAHPIAGKEVSGIEHAEASLYTGRQVVLTPVKATLRSNVQRASQVWSGIGANVVTMTHEEHDAAFAAVSHLPHLLAFAYTNALAAQPQGDRFLGLAGPGFSRFLAHRRQRSGHVARRAAGQPRAGAAAVAGLPQGAARPRGADDRGDLQALEQSIAAASKARAAWQPNTDASPTGQLTCSRRIPRPSSPGGAAGTVRCRAPRASRTACCCWPRWRAAPPRSTTCSTPTTPA